MHCCHGSPSIDGQTALERLRGGGRSQRKIPEFGESILHKPLAQEASDGTQYFTGGILGMRDRSAEISVYDGEQLIRDVLLDERMTDERKQADAAVKLARAEELHSLGIDAPSGQTVRSVRLLASPSRWSCEQT